MEQKFVYISMPTGKFAREDISFFASADAAYEDYKSRDSTRQLSKIEFVQSIEDTEIIEEGKTVWYRDQMVS